MGASCNTKKVKLSLVGSMGKMGQMIAKLAKEDPSFELGDDPDVVIDFSSPEGTLKAIQLQKPLVCGTTGLSQEIFYQLEELSKIVPVLYSPNFSVGMSLFFEILQSFGQKLNQFAKVDIEEIHNTQKKDSPSGTALKIGELLGVDLIASKRVEEMVWVHQTKFLFDHEILSFRHEAFSRKAFAQGALNAAKFIFNKPPKMYPFSEIFIENNLGKEG